ncbi:MAG TPA: mycothiol synthase [Ilumatobacter sp.]
MRVVEIIRRPDEGERADLVDFVEQVGAATGARPISDHLWLDLTTGDAEGMIVVSVADPDGLLGIAQVSSANASSSLEVVLRPGVPDARAVHDDLVETAVRAFGFDGGGRLWWWADDADHHDRALAERLGLVPARRLHEMRLGLPIAEHATVATRAFRPDDAAAWLLVNNRAFADHGEQGGWTHDTLTARMSEPWFDPDGFRLHERDGRLAAFCWTKLHPDPPLGEIYVIAVDPDFHGTGLGRQLTLAGLDWIAGRGITTAMLHVDADNVAAVSLYERLGFTVHSTRLAFSADLPALDEARPA